MMASWLKYLSGNVPGGFFLYLLILAIIFLILFFIHQANELFTRKYMIRWGIVSFIFITLVYVIIWIKNPPPQVLKRYTVQIVEDGKSSWTAHYVNRWLSEYLTPYTSTREYFFPTSWFYRVTPSDSGSSPFLRKNAFKKMPIQKVLQGEISHTGAGFSVRFQLVNYPSEQVIKSAQAEFHSLISPQFFQWVQHEFGGLLPLKNNPVAFQNLVADSLLEEVYSLYAQRKYQPALDLLSNLPAYLKEHREYEILWNLIKIKLAGEGSKSEKIKNPYQMEPPIWKKDLQQARDRLLAYLQTGYHHPQIDLVIAESYIWEQNFGSAEVFLEKLLLENPFDIDALLNLSFLHPSRYKEFGFRSATEIYQKILDVCPLEEAVLLEWVNRIILRNPGYTAPPQYAQQRLKDYLDINPHSCKAWLMLGQLYAHQMQKDPALQAYLKAQALAPQSGVVHYNIGSLYYDWKKYELAKEHFLKAIALENYLDAYLYLGAILKEEGRYEDALEKFRYRVIHKQGDDDTYAYEAMKGIQACLEALGQKP